MDGIFVNSNQNCFNDINSNRWMASAVITRSQAMQAIDRAESDGMVRGEGAASRPPQNVRSARRNGIARREETCKRERDWSSAWSQVSALNDGKGKQSDKDGVVQAASTGPDTARSSRAGRRADETVDDLRAEVFSRDGESITTDARDSQGASGDYEGGSHGIMENYESN